MQERSLTKTFILTLVSIAVVLFLLGTATFAWFTSNRKVGTGTASARVGEADVKLLLGSSESDLKDSGEVNISPVNELAQNLESGADSARLIPVSTSDLENWVYCPGTTSDNEQGIAVKASTFKSVENEQYYYHGELYMRAEATQPDEDSKMKIYFDAGEDAGGKLGKEEDGGTNEGFIKAGRLGLVFSDQDDQEQKIFLFEDSSENIENANINTYVGDSQIGDNQVLDSSGGADSVTAVDDPAVLFMDYSLVRDSDDTQIPEKPITVIDVNRTYKVDVYCYLEGCDKDCVDDIQLSEAQIHLAFYGILE